MDSIGQYIATRLYDISMAPLERHNLRRFRRRVVKGARGDVLEIGAGTGANLPFYHWSQISSLTMSDLSGREEHYRRRFFGITPKHRMPPLSTAIIDATRLPFPDNHFDTVVATLVFCSVKCPSCGLEEILRVLAPGGRYLFLEHVRPDQKRLRRVFDAVNPLWRRIAGGCNLNRDTLARMQHAGLTVTTYGHSKHGIFVYGEAYA